MYVCLIAKLVPIHSFRFSVSIFLHLYISQFFSKSLKLVRKYGNLEISWQNKAGKLLECPY